jgi:hypothetical protein
LALALVAFRRSIPPFLELGQDRHFLKVLGAETRPVMKAINLRTAEELGIHEQQIAANISLLDRGATVPFVAC